MVRSAKLKSGERTSHLDGLPVVNINGVKAAQVELGLSVKLDLELLLSQSSHGVLGEALQIKNLCVLLYLDRELAGRLGLGDVNGEERRLFVALCVLQAQLSREAVQRGVEAAVALGNRREPKVDLIRPGVCDFLRRDLQRRVVDGTLGDVRNTDIDADFRLEKPDTL